MAKKLFKDKTSSEATDSLVSFMPGGRPFLAARLPATKLRKLLVGLAGEILRVDGTLNEMTSEHDINTTTLLIEEWERALGIPDSCFSTDVDLPTRRLQVLVKLAKMGLQTEQDYIDLAALFGYTIETTAGADRGLFPFKLKFPTFFFDSPQSARYTLIITFITLESPNRFALDFAIDFTGDLSNVVRCLFNKLVPSNVDVVYEYRLPDETAYITEDGSYYLTTEADEILEIEP